MKNMFLLIRLLWISLLVPLLFSSPVIAVQAPRVSLDMLAIQGEWVRTDAPYKLELSLGSKGELEAKYFNRKYINVEETAVSTDGGAQLIMVRLQDVNYDGSVYLLKYDRDRDVLLGIYVHGASGQQFRVAFSRKQPTG